MDTPQRSSGSESHHVNQPTHAQPPTFSHLAVVTFHGKWHPDRTCTIQSSDELAWEVGRYLCTDLPTADAYATLRTYRVRNYGHAAGTIKEIVDASPDV